MELIELVITVFACLICFLIGCFVTHVKDRRNFESEIPAAGYLLFNVNEPSKEFLELHITQDIDLENPPEYVKFLILVPRRDEDGGKT